LVDVVIGAFPCLELIRVGCDPIREVEAQSLVLQRDAMIIGDIPLLLRKPVVALPDLHEHAIRGVRAGVEAEIRPSELDLSRPTLEDPLLSTGAVAIVDLDRRPVLLHVPAHVHALRRVIVRVQRLTRRDGGLGDDFRARCQRHGLRRGNACGCRERHRRARRRGG